jgi:hypothetical protein
MGYPGTKFKVWSAAVGPFSNANALLLQSATSMSSMFENSSFNQPLLTFKTSKVTDFSFMFAYATSFNQKIDSWDVSSAKSLRSMFNGASKFNQPLNAWSVDNVYDFFGILSSSSFNQVRIHRHRMLCTEHV